MADYKLSADAQRSLDEIYYESFALFGAEQARRYLFELDDAMMQLTHFPSLGQRCDHLREGLRRRYVGSHTVYYRIIAPDILVVDILHQSMQPERHLPDEN